VLFQTAKSWKIFANKASLGTRPLSGTYTFMKFQPFTNNAGFHGIMSFSRTTHNFTENLTTMKSWIIRPHLEYRTTDTMVEFLNSWLSQKSYDEVRVWQANRPTARPRAGADGSQPSKPSKHKRRLSSSLNNNPGLPGYTPQSISPPPSYDNVMKRHHDKTSRPTVPSKFRQRSLSDVRNTKLEP